MSIAEVRVPDAHGGDALEWIRVLGRLNEAVNQLDDMGHFLDRVAEAAAQLSGSDYAMVRVAGADDRAPQFGFCRLSSFYASRLLQGSLGDERGRDILWTPITEALRTGQPSFVPDLESEPRLDYWQAIARDEGVKSFASFPLMSTGGCLGVLNVYYRRPHEFEAVETSLVVAIAGYAAVVIEAAILRREKEAQLAALTASLRRRALVDDLHREIAAVALSRKGLEGALVALQQVLDASAILETNPHRIVASASGAARTAEIQWLIELASGWSLDERPTKTQRLEKAPDASRRLFRSPIILEDTVVGRLWMLAPTEIDEALAVQAIESAAIAVTLELTGRTVEEQRGERAYEEVLDDLLSSNEAQRQHAVATALRLGHNLTEGPVGVILAGDPASRGASAEARTISAELRRRVERIDPAPLVSRRGGVVAVVVPLDRCPETTAHRRILTVVERTIRASGAVSRDWPIVLSRPVAALSSLPRAWDIAERFLQLALRGSDSATTIDVRELSLVELLVEAADSDSLARFHLEVLGPLLEYDARHNADLLKTLTVYFENDMRGRETAASLVVHPNTLSYRLGRIHEITGQDPRSLEASLTLRMACLIHRVLGR